MDDEEGSSGFLIEVGTERHVWMAEEISSVMEESARARGTGISKRPPELIAHYLREGKALIAIGNDGSWAGFCYMNVFDNGCFVSSSGLIVSPRWRDRGVAHQLKVRLFELSKNLYPNASLIGITTSPAVMKINTALGFYPTAFSDMPQDDAFWRGCESCVNHDILVRTNRKLCLCTAMRYDPEIPHTTAHKPLSTALLSGN